MDVVTAREVMAETARLIEYSAAFQAAYGRFYTLKPGSPPDAWARYNGIMDSQTRIARLLNVTPGTQTPHRCGEWWKREDVIDTGVLRELAAEASNLLISCAFFEGAATHDRDWSYVVELSQRSIAGMLHPSTLLMAQDTHHMVRQSA